LLENGDVRTFDYLASDSVKLKHFVQLRCALIAFGLAIATWVLAVPCALYLSGSQITVGGKIYLSLFGELIAFTYAGIGLISIVVSFYAILRARSGREKIKIIATISIISIFMCLISEFFLYSVICFVTTRSNS
jgi:hypothetical protein